MPEPVKTVATNGKNGHSIPPVVAISTGTTGTMGNGGGNGKRGGEERRRRERQKQLAEAEKQISTWEARLNQISEEMAAAGSDGAVERLTQLSQEYERLHEQLEGLYGRWSQLTAELDELLVAP